MYNQHYQELSLEALWKMCSRNDQNALKEIYEREYPNLLAYGMKISKSKAYVQDAIQEVFTDMWQKKEDRKEIKNLRFYLLKSLKYSLLKQDHKNIIDIDALVQTKEILEPVNNDDSDEMESYVTEILSRLPKEQQQILHLKYFQSLTNEQISDLLDIKYQSVSNRLHRVIKKFRLEFQKKMSS